jgi:hypothetical protein
MQTPEVPIKRGCVNWDYGKVEMGYYNSLGTISALKAKREMQRNVGDGCTS